MKVTAVEVDGGISRQKTARSLRRVSSELQACLRKPIARAAVPAKGVMKIQSSISSRGRMQEIRITGPLSGVSGCLKGVFKAAKLPRADTGAGRLRFRVEYRTRS